MKRTRKAKATQAQKLRNSAKGKVPKSALGELGKGLNALLPGAAVPWRNWRWSQGFTCYPGVSRLPAVRRPRSGVLGTRR